MDDLFIIEDNFVEEYEEYEEEPDTAMNAAGMKNIMAALDSRNYSYYDQFGSSSEARDKVWKMEAVPALRWLSSVGESKLDLAAAKAQGRIKGDGKGPWPSFNSDTENTIMYLLMVNEMVNQNFWTLTSHPKLLFLLMCSCGVGKLNRGENHNWIPMVKKQKQHDKFDALISKVFKNVNSLELKILSNKYKTKEGITKICKILGLEDKEIKSTIKEVLDKEKNGKTSSKK